MKNLTKKIFTLVTCLLLVFSFCTPTYAYTENSDIAKGLYSTHYIFMDADSGQVLSQKDADEQISVASLTKMMTVLLAIENSSSLNDRITITDDMLDGLYEEEASVAGYTVGDTPTILDLCYATALPSAADAANALAIHVAGSYEAFYAMMNAKASSIGMNNSVFQSAHGLDRDGQHSTVRDMATLLRYGLQNATFKEIFSAHEYTTSPTINFPSGIQLEHTIWSSADVNGYQINGLLGGKTGYTGDAGRCLAYWANINDMNIIGVTQGAPSIPGSPSSNIKDAETALINLSAWHPKAVLTTSQAITNITYKSFMHTSNIAIKIDKDITLDLPDDVEVTITNDLAKSYEAKLYDQNIQANISFLVNDTQIYNRTITITLPKESNFFGRIILHLKNFLKG